VLVVDELQPRNKWLVGVIDETFADKNGFVRSVNVRLWVGEGKKRRQAIYHKPIVKCCILKEAAEQAANPDQAQVAPGSGGEGE
jgi:hypothetical protein